MKVADLTEDKLKALIGEVVEEKLRSFLDPDFGLELQEDFIKKLEASETSSERVPFEEVKKKLGLS